MNELVLVFTLAGRRAALRACDIHSVVELEAPVRVPQAPAFVMGLSALRSSTLTVIDAAAALGFKPIGVSPAGQRAAVVDHGGHRYALVVDAIDDVAEQFSTPARVPGEAGPGWQRACEGLIETARGPALLISLEALLSGPATRAA